MTVFRVRELAAARRRVAGLGVRVVWTAGLPGIAATRLHPGGLPGAIVSLDWAATAIAEVGTRPVVDGTGAGHAPGGGPWVTGGVRFAGEEG